MSSPFDALGGSVIATIQSVFGSATVFTYSRPESSRFNSLAPFAISAALDAGGIYATPGGDLAAGLLILDSDIPGGPQKGDQVAIAHSPAREIDGNYLVQELSMSDKQLGWSTLGIRLISQ
jgi:hypothetical protein